MLNEGAKGVLGFPAETPKTVLCTVQSPVLGCFPGCETGVFTVRETLLGLSAGGPQMIFSTLGLAPGPRNLN